MVGSALNQLLLDLDRRLSGRQARTVGYPEDVCIDGNCRLREGDVADHIGGLPFLLIISRII